MSRTDVHTPYWVKKLQPEWRPYFVEHHDHADRPCNFDVKNDNWHKDCFLTDLYLGRNIHCGCPLCTGSIWRRMGRRQERHRTKKLLRAERWDDIYQTRQWGY